jgi:hypothetical protein
VTKNEQPKPVVTDTAKPLAKRRKPTMEEEIKYTKRYDIKVCGMR